MPPQAFGEEFDFLFFGLGAEEKFTVEGKYAVVDICGPLEQHSSWRLDSFDSIRERVSAALASESPEVCLRVCSPGGHFAGCLELAREIRAMATAAKKPIKAFVDSQALSAGYALVAPCDEIVITPSASVGSVGVWSALIDATKQDEARGLKIEVVASDENKADRNPHVAMTPESIQRLRGEVEEMAEMFREEVAEGRGIRPSSLRKLKGAAVLGANAVKAHLADRLVDSWGAFISSDTKSQASNGENKMSLYSKAAMQKAAAEGDEDAKKALAAMAKADDDDAEMKKAEEKKAKAKEEEDAKKAKGDSPIKDGDEKDAKALADVIARVQAMESTASAREAKALEDDTRAKLLATRPDFSDAVLEVLALAPIAALEKAVKDFPKSTFRNPNTAAAKAHGTPGQGAGDLELGLPTEFQALLERKMPLGGRAPVAFSVGCGDREAAAKFLAAQQNGAGK